MGKNKTKFPKMIYGKTHSIIYMGESDKKMSSATQPWIKHAVLHASRWKFLGRSSGTISSRSMVAQFVCGSTSMLPPKHWRRGWVSWLPRSYSSRGIFVFKSKILIVNSRGIFVLEVLKGYTSYLRIYKNKNASIETCRDM